ncbi:MAG: hypothetical protein K0R48_613, partial [Gammaproteobacteria bacterium]|nr:hypothetical protein [Gammaproteobacteria bacterium]
MADYGTSLAEQAYAVGMRLFLYGYFIAG